MGDRGRVLLIAAAALLVLFLVSARTLSGFFIDFLWHDSVDRKDVFWGVLGSKVLLFVVAATVFITIAVINLLIADRLAPSTFSANMHPIVERFHEIFGRRLRLVRYGLAVVFGLLFALPATGHWQDWLLFRNSQSFGVKDAEFGNDIGFYIFQLPFITFVLDWLYAAVIFVTLLVLLTHVLNGGVLIQPPRPKVRRATKAHLAVLLALLLVRLHDERLHSGGVDDAAEECHDDPERRCDDRPSPRARLQRRHEQPDGTEPHQRHRDVPGREQRPPRGLRRGDGPAGQHGDVLRAEQADTDRGADRDHRERGRRAEHDDADELDHQQPGAPGRAQQQVAQRPLTGLARDGVPGHDSDRQGQEQRDADDQGGDADEQPVVGDPVQERRAVAGVRPVEEVHGGGDEDRHGGQHGEDRQVPAPGEHHAQLAGQQRGSGAQRRGAGRAGVGAGGPVRQRPRTLRP